MNRQTPDAVATIDGARRTTWRELTDRVARLAGILRARGVEDGDRVAILAGNSDRHLELLLATLWAGAAFTSINVRWTVPEIAFALADCEPALLIVDEPFVALATDAVAGSEVAPTIERLGRDADDADSLQAAIARTEPIEDRMRVDDDLATLVYTGGTTGRSKGVMLGHRGLVASASSYAAYGTTFGGTSLLVAPLFHVAGVGSTIGALLLGSSIVIVPAFDPPAIFAAIERERVTDVFLVPTMVQALLDHPRFAEFDLSSLERIVYGASPISEALMDRALAAFAHVAFLQAYGMTELSPIATLLGPEDHLPSARASGRLRSAGRPTMQAEVRVVDANDREVPRGEAGEIVARGGGVMLGYWKRPAETAEALRGGWMHTGDIGRMDEAGYVFVVDRLKDMIVSGGENVYSAEVENALASHPAVAQCAVIGVPHPFWGQAVHAVVVHVPGASLDEAELVAHCRRTIAGYKVPRSVEFRDALPLTAAGKVLKTELRATGSAS